jgi:hypothetical protein
MGAAQPLQGVWCDVHQAGRSGQLLSGQKACPHFFYGQLILMEHSMAVRTNWGQLTDGRKPDFSGSRVTKGHSMMCFDEILAQVTVALKKAESATLASE